MLQKPETMMNPKNQRIGYSIAPACRTPFAKRNILSGSQWFAQSMRAFSRAPETPSLAAGAVLV
jgi:hypothetical protein